MTEANICPVCGAEWPDAGVCSGVEGDSHPPEITEEVLFGEVVVTANQITAVVVSSEPVAADRVVAEIPEGGAISISFRKDGKPMLGPALSRNVSSS